MSVNSLGSMIVAAVTAANKLSMFFTAAFDAMGIAMSTYGGQNIGARKPERLSPGLRAGMVIGSIYSVFALIIIFFFGRSLALLFVDSGETEIIENTYRYLLTNAAFYIPLTGVNVFRLLLQGIGYSKIAIFAGVCEMVARGITGLFLVPAFGFSAACFASPIAWVMADLFLVPVYFRVMKNIRQYGR